MTILRLNLLGTFQAFAGDKPLTTFRSDKVRALLIYLMVEADRPHRREVLATLLWPEFNQEAATRNFRKNLFLLRQSIDEISPGLSDLLLTITRQTIQVNRGYKRVDLEEFQETLNHIEKHSHQQLLTCQSCLKNLIKAADLYQGELVAGFSLADSPNFDSWLLLQRESLIQEIMVVLENLTASYELKSDFQRAKYYANRQLAVEPWREKAHRQLMRALALEGRRGESIAQYETCRETLWEELGVKPEPKTLLLYQKIKNGLLVAEGPDNRTKLHDFPTQFTNFIGRKSILDQIVERLSSNECRHLTLVGQGGIGKTRLTIEAAHHLAQKGCFPGGIYFVPLTDVHDGDHLMLTMASQLKISIFGRHHIRQHLLNYLAEQEILLVLDNFEQLVAESDLLTELLQASPKIKLLVSSREALNIRSEQRILVGGMTEESAVSLFKVAARKNMPDYLPTEEDLPVIQDICNLVGRIPLAVEIAATWVKMMDLKTISSQIKHDIDFLQNQMQNVSGRHQSMKIIFEESWKLLSPGEQNALAQFSIFKSGFSLNAAVAITKARINEIASLLDKSLLEHQGKSRYKLHELLRQFAQSKLANSSTEESQKALQSAYAQYYMELVNRNEILLFGASPQFGLAEIEAEIDNVLQGWRWAIEHDRVDLLSTGLNGMRMYYTLGGRFEEGAEFVCSSIDPISSGDETPDRAKLICRLLTIAGDFSNQSGQLDKGYEYLWKALQMCEQHDWPDCLTVAQRLMGDYFNLKGRYEEGIQYLQKAIAYQGHTKADQISLVESYYRLGIIYWRAEKFEDTRRIQIQALNLAQQITFNWAVDLILMSLGWAYRKLGEFDTALDYYTRAIDLALEISYFPGAARGSASAGLIQEDKGNYEKALEFYTNALKYDDEFGDKLRYAVDNANTARVLWKMGRLEEALSLINETITISRVLGYKVHTAWQLIVKADILFDLKRYQEAWQVNEEGQLMAIETSLSQRTLQSQELAARLELVFGKPEAARLRLNKMLEDDPDIFTIASVHYFFWRMTRDVSHAKQALAYYREAYAQEPYIEWKKRIDELTLALS